MVEVKFRYRDDMSNWEWRELKCVVSSVEKAIEIYGLGKGCDYEIISVNEIK